MRFVVPLASAAVLALGARGAADEVRLSGGGTLVGEVSETDTHVRVAVAGGAVTLPRDRVASIERTPGASAPPAGAVGALPDDPSADAALRALHGPGAGLVVTAHYRIAHDAGVRDMRARADRFEAAYAKFHAWCASLGIPAAQVGRKLEVRVFASFERFAAALARPSDEVKGLTGIYDHGAGRVLVYDVEESPDVRAARTAISEAEEKLAAARSALLGVQQAIASLTAERAAVRGASARAARDALDARLAAVRADESSARESVEGLEREIEARRRALDEHVERESFASVTHEAAHQVAFATGVCRAGQPLWLVEGIATLFEVQGRGTFVPDAPNRARLGDLRGARAAGRRTRLADILSDRVLAAGAAGRSAAYAECWSVVHFLARKHPAALAAAVAERDPARVAALVLPLETEWESFLKPLVAAGPN
ncbi:MAG: hypothetical protein HMLKMBBP_00199 [Planctomycetes bacterium]|nr:hypothetical protein [Planctomycetota bacterium]